MSTSPQTPLATSGQAAESLPVKRAFETADLGQFRKIIDQLNRRARRLGIAPIEYTVGRPVARVVHKRFFHGADEVQASLAGGEEGRVSGAAIQLPDGQILQGASVEDLRRQLPENARAAAVEGFVTEGGKFVSQAEAAKLEREAGTGVRGVKAIVDVYPVEVSTHRVKLPGDWNFVARLEHYPEGNLIAAVPGENVPEMFRASPCVCDHCRVDRKRNATFVVRNDSNGKHVQVGSSCMEDFLGHESPAAIADKLAFCADVFVTLDEQAKASLAAAAGSPDARRIDLREAMAWTAAITQRCGYVKAGEGWPTKLLVRQFMEAVGSPPPLPRDLDSLGVVPPGPSEQAVADEVVAWVRDELAQKTPLSDYEHNLVMVFAADLIAPKMLGVAVSALPTMRREKEMRKKRESEPVSRFVGKPGERADFKLTLQREIPLFSEQFGTSTILLFTDADGNSFKWKTGTRVPCKVGETVCMKATIAEHDVYQRKDGTRLKQNVLRIAKVIPEVKKPPQPYYAETAELEPIKREDMLREVSARSPEPEQPF